MEKITYKNILKTLKSRMILLVAGGLVLTSCSTQMGGYSETDGVYYDPNKDTIPQGTMMHTGNQVGDYYDFQATDGTNTYLNSENRNKSWQDAQSSDWGSYAGTDIYFNQNWGNPYWYGGFGLGFNYGWGSPWGYGYYNPWYGYYNPWYGFYNPYPGFYPFYPHYYYPYYGYGNSYNGGFRYRRSGNVGSVANSFRNGDNSLRNNNSSTSGFRSDGSRIYQNSNNNGFRQQNTTQQPRLRNTESTTPRQVQPRQTAPTYNEPRFRGNTNDAGGFRSGGGGFNSGSSSSGSTRSSGGFRR